MTPALGAKAFDGAARQVLMVDPSLFTAPYDARLSDGLDEMGIDAIWATRRLRVGEEDELRRRRPFFFYPLTDGPRRRIGRAAQLLKGVEHAIGLRKLVRYTARKSLRLVHFQWLLVPALDRRAIGRIRAFMPVVVTVHDSEPFNGKAVSRAQRAGFDDALALADRLIVHTASARQALVARGLDERRIVVVPHGPLGRGRATPRAEAAPSGRRWTIVQFGKMQRYKGIDLLVEALGRMAPIKREALRLIVAGEPLIDLAPLRARVAALGLSSETLDFRPHYLSAAELDALVDEADAFVFPYRAIEASGALMLVADAGKWIVASRLGAFAELIGDGGETGELVPPGDVAALAEALTRSVGRYPCRSAPRSMIPDWATIGRMTAEVYRGAEETWSSRAEAGAA